MLWTLTDKTCRSKMRLRVTNSKSPVSMSLNTVHGMHGCCQDKLQNPSDESRETTRKPSLSSWRCQHNALDTNRQNMPFKKTAQSQYTQSRPTPVTQHRAWNARVRPSISILNFHTGRFNPKTPQDQLTGLASALFYSTVGQITSCSPWHKLASPTWGRQITA